MKIPREHGLYVVVASCWLTGLVVEKETDWPHALLLLSVATLLLFLFAPIRDRLRARRRGGEPHLQGIDRVLIPLIGVAIVTGSYVLFARAPALAPLAVLGIALAVSYGISLRRRMTMIAQSIPGFLAATLLTPATILVSNPDATIPSLVSSWGAVASYFCASIFMVRLRLEGRSGARPALIYHGIATIALLIMISRGVPPIPLLLPMGLSWIRFAVIWGKFQRWQELPLKRIGMIETAAALAVVCLIAVAS